MSNCHVCNNPNACGCEAAELRAEVARVQSLTDMMGANVDSLEAEVARLTEHDRIRAKVIADHQGRLIAADAALAEVARLTVERDEAQRQIIKAVEAVDRQWCNNIDACTDRELAPAVDATITQLRAERDEIVRVNLRLLKLVGEPMDYDDEHWSGCSRVEAIRQANEFHAGQLRWMEEHDRRREERDVAVAEVARLTTERDRQAKLCAHSQCTYAAEYAERLARQQPVIQAAKAWRAQFSAKSYTSPEAEELIAAVDALAATQPTGDGDG